MTDQRNGKGRFLGGHDPLFPGSNTDKDYTKKLQRMMKKQKKETR